MRKLICKQKFSAATFKKGSILIIATLVLGIMLFLGTYFISFSLTGSKMADSHKAATQTYYLAEAGINKAVWKLKYDEWGTTIDGDVPWAICFVTSTAPCTDCSNWSATFATSTDSLISGSNVTVTIDNSECGKGEIIATATVLLPGGKTSQRVVKTTVLKALASPTDDAVMFTGSQGENILVKNSKIRVHGNVFCSKKLDIKGTSIVEVYRSSSTSTDGKVLVIKDLAGESQIATSVAKCAANICDTTSTCSCATNPDDFQECTDSQCRSWPVTIPEVDFNEGPNSFGSRAQIAEDVGECQNLCNGSSCMCNGNPCAGNEKCVLNGGEFEDLLWAAGEGGTLTLGASTLPTITYVTGPINLEGNRHLIVYGVLVADDTIDVGTNEGDFQITIKRPTATTASGLLAQRDIRFGEYLASATTTITGVVYTMGRIIWDNVPGSFTVEGGVIGRMLKFTGVSEWLNLILDNEVVRYGLGYKIDGEDIKPAYSPIITIDHWEEEY